MMLTSEGQRETKESVCLLVPPESTLSTKAMRRRNSETEVELSVLVLGFLMLTKTLVVPPEKYEPLFFLT